jgi:hypothetical protein
MAADSIERAALELLDACKELSEADERVQQLAGELGEIAATAADKGECEPMFVDPIQRYAASLKDTLRMTVGVDPIHEARGLLDFVERLAAPSRAA